MGRRFIENMIDSRYKRYTIDEKFRILGIYASEPQNKDVGIAEIGNNEYFLYDLEYYPVGQWITYFRRRYSLGELDKDIKSKLDNLKMNWNADNKTYETFEEKIEVLTAYKNDPKAGNGTIGFISQTDKYCYKGKVYSVGAWIKAFRKAYAGKDGYKKLTPKQIRELEDLGMIWDAEYQKGRSKQRILQNRTK